MTIKQFQKELASFLNSQNKSHLDVITYQCCGENEHDYTFILISKDTGFIKGTFIVREDLAYAYCVKIEENHYFEISLVDFLNKTLEGE